MGEGGIKVNKRIKCKTHGEDRTHTSITPIWRPERLSAPAQSRKTKSLIYLRTLPIGNDVKSIYCLSLHN